MNRLRVFIDALPSAPVTRTAKEKLPEALGKPLIWPVPDPSVNPAGNGLDPGARLQV
jgi:hypothetical protein